MRTTPVSLFRVMSVLIFLQSGLGVARSQSVTSTGPERVSVRAENERLGDLLREIQTVVGIDKLIIDPGIENRPVSITVEDEPIDEAIMEILEAANVSGVVWGGNGQPYRVFAGSGEGTKVAEPNQPPPARENTNPRAPRGGRPSPREAPGASDDPGFGSGRTATGEASLLVRPTIPRLAGVGAILGLGLLLGQLLVVRTH